MSKYYYKYRKNNHNPFRKWLRVISLVILFLGLAVSLYIFAPLIFWQIYFSPTFAYQNNMQDKDYTNAKNWFPNFNPSKDFRQPKVSLYTLSIPKLDIKDASVSTTDMDLGKHLVNYPGTSIPGDSGNAVIFGHSTLPQLYNPKVYKTIFSNVYKIKIGDSIYATVNGVTYLHKVYSITVIDPNDTSAFVQDYDNSYLTLVTCTPPGTVWKRLVIKARLSKV